MIAKRNGLKEEIQRVLEEVLKAVDFDMETFSEASPEEMRAVVFDAIISVIDPEEVPFIGWVRMVEDAEVEELRNEKGEFVPN